MNTIRLFLDLGKKTIKSNLDWGDAYKKISGLKGELQEQSKQPLVSPDISREEFAKRFLHLSLCKYACMLSLIFSIIRSCGDQPMYGSLSAIGAAIIFFVLTMQFSYRSWVAEFIWTKWDKRLQLNKPRFGKFVENLITRPLIIFSFNLD